MLRSSTSKRTRSANPGVPHGSTVPSGEVMQGMRLERDWTVRNSAVV